MSSKSEFCGNWTSGSYSVPKDINEYLPLLSIFIDQFGWNFGKEDLYKK